MLQLLTTQTHGAIVSTKEAVTSLQERPPYSHSIKSITVMVWLKVWQQ